MKGSIFFSNKELSNFRDDVGGIGQVCPLSSALNVRKVFYRRTLFNFTTSRILDMGSVTGWLDSSHMLQYVVLLDHLKLSHFISSQYSLDLLDNA